MVSNVGICASERKDAMSEQTEARADSSAEQPAPSGNKYTHSEKFLFNWQIALINSQRSNFIFNAA